MQERIPDQARLIYDLFCKNDKALMIVLDACNWKITSACKPRWPLRIARSRGSNTSEWLVRTFTKVLPDVVYVSSNPFTYVLKSIRAKFRHVVDLYQICWDDNLQTIKPRNVSFFVKQKLLSGEKKVIAHYMQPHAPFLTKTWLNRYSHRLDFKDKLRTPEIYEISRKSFDARDEFRRAYIENFKVVARHAESLVKYVKDSDPEFKTVITSDHSEILKGLYHPLRDKRKFWFWVGWLLGIYRFIGHESKSRFRQLYEVPWIAF